MTRRINLFLAASCLALILVGVIIFAATGNTAEAATAPDPTASSATSPPTAADQAASDGQALYATHCASCHGTTGSGGSGGPVDDLDLTRQEVIDITADGVPRMPGYSDVLTIDEIEAVADYTLSLGD